MENLNIRPEGPNSVARQELPYNWRMPITKLNIRVSIKTGVNL